MSSPTAHMPFHAGERRMHELTGVAEQILPRGRAMIRAFMPDQHRDFFAQLPFVLVGGLDDTLQPWATVWTGEPGFMQSPEATVLRVHPEVLPGDPLGDPRGDPSGDQQQGGWRHGRPVGLLGIQPHTRRRNRMNGLLRMPADGGERFDIEVRQSFGNCPKYIHPRLLTHEVREVNEAAKPANSVQVLGPAASPEAMALITRSDTLFIASASADASREDLPTPASGVDISHRGGEPGFVHTHVAEDGSLELTLPDYTGNFMFNTLGNILQNPSVGLLFMDFKQGDVLWLACLAQVDMNSPAIAEHAGAQRLVHLRVQQGRWAPACLPLRSHDRP